MHILVSFFAPVVVISDYQLLRRMPKSLSNRLIIQANRKIRTANWVVKACLRMEAGLEEVEVDTPIRIDLILPPGVRGTGTVRSRDDPDRRCSDSGTVRVLAVKGRN